jgi:hypothetical protein
MNCEQVEVLVGARLDGSLDLRDRGLMDAHIAGCSDCRAMLSDIERLVADARVLPPLSPSHDLWRDVEAKLGAQDTVVEDSAPVQSLEGFRQRRESVPWRMLAAAAVLLVAVTAGVTWNIARVDSSDDTTPRVASVQQTTPDDPQAQSTGGKNAVTPDPADSRVPARNVSAVAPVTRDSFELRRAALEAQYVASSAEEVDAIYEREIVALRRIVDDRFTELDSVTVAELRKNLDIIDRAIIDSKAALRRDPRSRLLSRQLDRALEHKMELLRRVALL